MNTGALKDRNGEDVELNSCSACAAGSCYAVWMGIALRLNRERYTAAAAGALSIRMLTR